MRASGEIDVHPEAGDPRGDFLRVSLYHPASGAREKLSLRRAGNGDFVGTLAQSTRSGRWIVTIESADWTASDDRDRAGRQGPRRDVACDPMMELACSSAARCRSCGRHS